VRNLGLKFKDLRGLCSINLIFSPLILTRVHFSYSFDPRGGPWWKRPTVT